MKSVYTKIVFSLILALSIPTLSFSNSEITASPDSTIRLLKPKKMGKTFYLKTEWLNTGLRYFFAKPTYDIDIQGTLRLTNHLHLVATYGETTFDLSTKVASIERQNVFQEVQRTGKAQHRSSLMFRYYPFEELEQLHHYLFFELGGHFAQYTGTTDYKIYDENAAIYETDYLHHLEMYRYGGQLNVGLSLFHVEKPRWDYLNNSTLIFSPEIFAGVSYTELQLLQDEYTTVIGTAPTETYSEQKFRLHLRAKLGIGFSKRPKSKTKSKIRF